MNQGKRKPENDYGHKVQEWGLVGNSEKLEWEEHYKNGNRKLEKDQVDEELSREDQDVDL